MPLPGAETLDDDARRGPSVETGFRAAIAAAGRFIGATAPNPPVGCAILDADGNILSVAAHPRAGEPHAEALALHACRQDGLLTRAATMVVTLEPCNHVGRTGPCTEAILASPIGTVWIGASDPNPRVAGGGEQRLRDAGLAVHRLPTASALALDCAALIVPFNRLVRGGRPWLTVKQALDASGSMIPQAGARTFTGPAALLLAHRVRRATDAIVTGMGTILADSPHFTVRHVPDHPARSRLLAVVGRGDALPDSYRRQAEARGFRLRTAADLPSLLTLLAGEGVLWAIIEAGPRLLASFDRDGLWDDWLTIRHDQQGGDQLTLRTRDALSPLRLIEGVPGLEKGTACSPAS